MKAVLADGDLACAYGLGLARTWDGLLGRRPAISPVARFDTTPFTARVAALMPGLVPDPETGWLAPLLNPLLAPRANRLPPGCDLLLATTTGEIDRLERAVRAGAQAAPESEPGVLLQRLRGQLGITGRAAVISAACASSTVAVCEAAERVLRGESSAVLVVACDVVTEFVFAGFSALMALDPGGARPFDRNRRGLTLGDGAAVALVMEASQARAEGRHIHAQLAGWGVTCDANHMTGPAQDGAGLARAIRAALGPDPAGAHGIGSICAHGTGTVYNDSMELKAFRAALPGPIPPVFSVKGGLGHTLGAAGLIELLIAGESMRLGVVPPTVGLVTPDPEAADLVAPASVSPAGPRALSTNSGFGGINAAVLLEPAEER